MQRYRSKILSLLVSVFVCPMAAQAEFSLDSEPSDPAALSLFGNRKAEASFDVDGRLIDADLTFNGISGSFRRPGTRLPDRLSSITYLTADRAEALADSGSGADAFSVAVNFFGGSCKVLIAAIWQISNGDSQGRVIWCATEYSPGLSFEGVYWASEKGLDWSDPIFTGTWNGTWL